MPFYQFVQIETSNNPHLQRIKKHVIISLRTLQKSQDSSSIGFNDVDPIPDLRFPL